MENTPAPGASPRERLRLWFAVLDRSYPVGSGLVRAVGRINLLVSCVALLWLLAAWYPYGGDRGGPVVVAVLLLLSLGGLLTLRAAWWDQWALPLPLAILALGMLDVAVLLGAGPRPSFHVLFFLWIGFAALTLTPRLGLVAVGGIAGVRLWAAVIAGGRGEVAEVVLVIIPCYLALFVWARLALGRQHALRQQRAAADDDAARLAALYDFSTLLGSERQIERLLAALVTGLAETFGYRYVSVFLLQNRRLHLQAQIGYITPITELGLGEGITGVVGLRGMPLLVRDGRSHPDYLFAEDHFGSQASVPLIHGGQVLGVLNLEGAINELGEEDLRLLATLAGPAAVAIENATLLARLDALAHRDPLTGLPNRRGIIGLLEGALAAPGGGVTILLVDLNGFKAVNDHYGHEGGDRLLVELAGLLARCARADAARPGTAGRLGGDEFLVVLPGADEYAAFLMVERLTDALATHTFPLPPTDIPAPPPAVGYSLGIATAPHDGTDPTALLAEADRAMYRAKRGSSGPIRFLARHTPTPALAPVAG